MSQFTLRSPHRAMMGIGMVLIVAEYYADSIVRTLRKEANLDAWVIGDVIEGNRDVTIE